jgi:hypothetical protein
MTDMFEPTAPEIVTETPVQPVAESTPEPTPPTDAWRTEAGRKGAQRIHQLIEAGRQYEQEHGLKSGRQRLRQLIELGKRYEEERGAAAPERKRRGTRLTRAERDEVVATLLRCLVRIAKPSFRPELTKLADALSPDAPKVEAPQAA